MIETNSKFSAKPPRGKIQTSNLIQHGLILAVLLLAFILRLRSLTLFQFHIDEFFSLAAANFIAKSGAPLYPTDLFYDPGLPFSYIDGLLFWLFGFSEALGRWPSVMFGTLAVGAVYWLGRWVLRSSMVGLIAALWLAISLESVEWGGRARMITLAQWLALLSVGLLWLGLTRQSVRHRLWFVLSYGATLLTHFSTVVLLPAWFVATCVLWRANAVKIRRALLRDALLLIVVAGLALSSGVIFQPPPTVEFQTGAQGLDSKVGLLTNKFLQIPSDVGHARDAYDPYFLQLPHGPILALVLVGIIIGIIRLIRKQSKTGDLGVLYLAGLFVTVMLVLALVINPHWQRARYLLMQVQGIFLLLGAFGLREIISFIPGRRWQIGSATLLVIILSIPFASQLENIIEGDSTGWDRYDQAFGHVRDNLSDGDKVMTMHPPASLLYLNKSDYYLAQSSPKLIVRPDGELGDRYSGALWLKSADEFNAVLNEQGRVWLVAQEFWIFNSYDPDLQQQILWRMDKLWGEGGVWALASRPDRWPLAKNIDIILKAEFDGGTELAGYSADPPSLMPGIPMRLTLFWQNNVPYGAKVFVHLRDADNNTVAQADHFIYDGKVPGSRWLSLLENETLVRDGATLMIPPELAPGVYRLVIGFYHPETFERLAVVNDQSGENAVILGEWVIQWW